MAGSASDNTGSGTASGLSAVQHVVVLKRTGQDIPMTEGRVYWFAARYVPEIGVVRTQHFDLLQVLLVEAGDVLAREARRIEMLQRFVAILHGPHQVLDRSGGEEAPVRIERIDAEILGPQDDSTLLQPLDHPAIAVPPDLGVTRDASYRLLALIRIVEPVHRVEVGEVLKRSGGDVVTLSEQQIEDAWRLVAREEGVFCEPASAAGVAAVAAAGAGGSVVCILTGHGLKDVEAVA